ncbi:patatin-like phospholipase family protein [Fretibacterium sp. OH1220_COT-178]|uniref:patatin-like phospholipase family protein n=1 Tax=Fretibacterium sp. OH1220_COT-178 TaxID=2491047 RepID=UPI0013154763|nr:patatin-like phospholipase family protein [Fretibacterium sp. OH1220_COT-178]
MRRFLCALLVLCLSPSLAAEAGVVLALSGGGTRGFAHIGVIEVLEEHKIPIVGIVGTSIGSLIGALKASGYDAAEMRRIVGELDLPSLLAENTGPMFVFTGNDQRAKRSTVSALTYKKAGPQRGPLGILTGDKLFQYFTQLMRHVSVTDFYMLPIPYAAVATDVNTGEKVVLRGGSLASAMRASMSIPALFEPWEVNDHLLVDGGLVSNLPIHTARELFPGCPVIGVDVSDTPSRERALNSYIDVIDQSLSIVMRRTTEEEGRYADLVIAPQVRSFSFLDSSQADAIIGRGREAALAHIEAIGRLSDAGPGILDLNIARSTSNTVGDVRVRGLPQKVAEDLRRRYLVWVGRPVDVERIEGALRRLMESPSIATVDYQLGRTGSGDVLVQLDVRQSPELEIGVSGYTTNLHRNRWLYVKGIARGLFSDYDSLSGVLRLGEQWGLDLSYQTAPEPMNAWEINLAVHKWKMETTGGMRDWDRYALGVNRVFRWGDVRLGVGVAYEHVEGTRGAGGDERDAVGPTLFASYDTLDIPSDPTEGHAWRLNVWWPNLEELNYRLTYFKPLEVGDDWRTYFRLGYAEGDLDFRSHAAYLGAAEELYSVSTRPVEAERMAWVNVAFRRVLKRSVLGIVAAEVFGSYGYAMDREYRKIASPWEIGLAVNFPNNIIDVKLAAMYGSEEFKVGFFLGVPIWDHYPLP